MTAILEVSTDRFRERLIIDTLAERYGSTFERYSDTQFSDLDYAIRKDGKTILVMELKCRQIPSTLYNDIFLSRNKYEKLSLHAGKGEIAVFIGAFFDGMIYGINVNRVEGIELAMMNRTKERPSGLIGANDEETGYYVPLSHMIHLGTLSGQRLVEYRVGLSLGNVEVPRSNT